MKIKLKLLLFSMMFIGLGLSFCSAEKVSDLIEFVGTGHIDYQATSTTTHFVNLFDIGTNYGTYCINFSNLGFTGGHSTTISFGFANSRVATPTNLYFLYFDQFGQIICLYGNKSYLNVGNRKINSSQNDTLTFSADYEIFKLNTLLDESIITSCPSSSIDVLYNNENSTTNITCNGDNVIQIDGLSTMTATNKFTPYFNINYRDEDNQSLIESYSKDILYLSGTLFKKTFTGDNERILTSQSNNNNSSSFSGYVPTFDIVFTGDTREDTGNVFNNFTQNSLQILLSNIPSYIQYVIIIMLLFFILGLARRKKRR